MMAATILDVTYCSLFSILSSPIPCPALPCPHTPLSYLTCLLCPTLLPIFSSHISTHSSLLPLSSSHTPFFISTSLSLLSSPSHLSLSPGTGKAVMAAAVLFPFVECSGVECLEGLHSVATDLLKTFIDKVKPKMPKRERDTSTCVYVEISKTTLVCHFLLRLSVH